MKVGWVSPEGTNTWETVSTVGTSIIIRIPTFRRLLERNHDVIWFGLKKQGHLIEGKDEGLKPVYRINDYIKEFLREAKKKWDGGKVKNPNGYSMSKWVTTTAIRKSLKVLRAAPPPDIDVLFAEYMDNGMPQIVFFTVLVLHYAARDVPIYVRDTENKFRYVSEYKILSDSVRDNMYSHRLGRYVAEEDIQSLRGKLRMVYAFDASEWDDGTNGFYRLPPLYFPLMYDPERELIIPLLSDKLTKPVVYIGNDNNRRPMFKKYYGGLKKYTARTLPADVRGRIRMADVYGNWQRSAPGFVEEMNPKRVRFNPPISQELMLRRLSESLCTVFVTKEIYAKCGQVTTRSAEVSLAGTLAVVPRRVPRADEWALSEFIVDDVDGMNKAIQFMTNMSDTAYVEAVYAQRGVIQNYYHADLMFDNLILAFMEDGVRV